jgi:hypothetical protein
MSTGGTEIHHNCCSFFGKDYLALGAGNRSVAVLYDNFSATSLHGQTESQVFQARVGLVPEPPSLTLLASGLIAVLAVGRRRQLARRR